MSKLAAAIRNHLVIVPYIEAKALFRRRPGQILAPTLQGPAISWRCPTVVVPNPSTALRMRLRPAEIEAMNASVREPRPPASTPPLLPDSGLRSLAGKAPALCSQLQRMGR